MLLAVLAFFIGSNGFAETQWKQVARSSFPWRDSRHLSTFILETPLNLERVEDLFTRLTIQTPGNPDFVLTDDDGLVNFRKDTCRFRFSFCKRANLIASDYLLLLPSAMGSPVLFVFGYGYASSPGSLHVIALSAGGKPYEIFSEREFDLYDFVDVDGDGLPEIVGKRCMSQGWGDDFLTYDPYSVFRLPQLHSEGPATYSLPLSRRYNLRHYYGWAGPDCSEDFTVVLHPPGGGRPVVVKKEEAERMSGHGP